MFVKYNTCNAQGVSNSDGVLRLWVDGSLQYENASFTWRDGQFADDIFRLFYIPSNAGSGIYLSQPGDIVYIDDVEIWDGMPTEETTTSSSTTTAAPLDHDAPNQLFSNSTAAGAQSGKTRPKLTDRTPALSGLVYPGSGGQIEDVQIQVSTDKKFHRVNKWDSGWRALTTPIDTRGDRTPDIEYGS